MEHKWKRARERFLQRAPIRKQYRTIPFLFYWNNCYAELTAKHRGENFIGRYSTSNSNVDHASIKYYITKREYQHYGRKKYRITK